MIPSRGGPATSIHVFRPCAQPLRHKHTQARDIMAESATPQDAANSRSHARLAFTQPRCHVDSRSDPRPRSCDARLTLGDMSDIIIPGVGSLQPAPALDHLDLLAPPVARALTALAERGVATASSALVVAIDPELADTEVMTREFGMDLALSSNCILVAGKRAGEERIAACVVRATTNADANHVVKKRLDVRKASFWPQDRAVEASGMEYGGITPVGVPSSWRLLIDSACASGWSCIGSGLRRSKLFVTGEVLAALPGAEIVEGLGV